MTTIWYRITDYSVSAGCDECGDPLPGPSRVGLTVEEYELVKETPQGVWLRPRSWRLVGSIRGDVDSGKDFWIKRDAHRRFACPTMAEALESFVARKRAQARIYRARADFARRAELAAQREFGTLAPCDELEALCL